MKRGMLIFLLGLLALAGILLGALCLWVHSYQTTPEPGSGKPIPVLIPKGAGPKTVAQLLVEHRVISDADAFYRYMRYYKRAAGKLKAGELAFRDNLTPEEVLDVLLEGTPITHSITIPEGLRIDELGRLFEEAGLADAKKFEAQAFDPKVAQALGVTGNSLEGFLFPETYHFRKETPVETILKTMVEGYRRVFTAAWRRRAEALGMTELQVVTLASIIEKEAAVAPERSLIAGVFHNRLKKNWRLDTDPTVIYAVLLAKGHFNGDLTREDLKINHPYNTRRHKGLPPGPICNPGKEALEATLYPEQTEYMFFVSKNDGTHHFCPDLACHNRAVAQYQGGGKP